MGPGFEEIDEFIAHTYRSYQRSLNVPDIDRPGDDIHIGIVDTLADPPSGVQSTLNIESTPDDYVDVDEDDPAGHGTTVLHQAIAFAPSATYSTFQIFQMEEVRGVEKPTASRGDVIDAVTDAADLGVDLINLSLGIADGCSRTCSLSREIELVANEDNITMVAATGNAIKGKRVGVHCPATLDVVIGVGGYVPGCTEPPTDSENSSQWWLENQDGKTIRGPYCGQNTCSNGKDCKNARREELWDGNVSFHNGVPDVLAPIMALTGESTERVQFKQATSFAAPIVTGIIATVLSELHRRDVSPSADQIRHAVFAPATEIDSGGFGKLNAGATLEQLLDEAR